MNQQTLEEQLKQADLKLNFDEYSGYCEPDGRVAKFVQHAVAADGNAHVFLRCSGYYQEYFSNHIARQGCHFDSYLTRVVSIHAMNSCDLELNVTDYLPWCISVMDDDLDKVLKKYHPTLEVSPKRYLRPQSQVLVPEHMMIFASLNPTAEEDVYELKAKVTLKDLTRKIISYKIDFSKASSFESFNEKHKGEDRGLMIL